MRIVGNFEPFNYNYYTRLKKMIVDFNLTDYVSLETDVSFETLNSLMKESKVYFHPNLGNTLEYPYLGHECRPHSCCIR